MKKVKTYNRSTELRKADEAFSLFIRTRDAQEFQGTAFKCISCGLVKPIRQADCGHFQNRQHMSLRYSELNCNAQCRRCNRFDEGNISGYRQGLIKKIGLSKVELLERLKNISKPTSATELHCIAEEYKKKVKDFEYQIK